MERVKTYKRQYGKSFKPHLCDDCKKDTVVIFMLKTDLWDTIALRNEFLCFKCTEVRLGRKITWEDLMPCGASNTLLVGALLMKRNPIDVDEDILDHI
jgi:hypothetical protein